MGKFKISIEPELRPCLVSCTDENERIVCEKAFFYGTYQTSVGIAAAVEFEDGRLDAVPIETVHLLDSAEKMQEYDFGEQAADTAPVVNCSHCKHEDTHASDYPCFGCLGYSEWEPKA